MIVYAVPVAGDVGLSVHDITGRLVKRLVVGGMNAGRYTCKFDGDGLTAGIYFVRLEERPTRLDGNPGVTDIVSTRRMVLLK